MKEATRKDLLARHSPLVLWDYCAERRAMIFQLSARDLFQLQGRTHILQLLERKLTYQIYVDMTGMIGYISGMEVQNFLTPSFRWVDA